MTADAAAIRAWLQTAQEASALKVTPIRFADCAEWQHRSGRLVHATGRFFEVKAIQADGLDGARYGPVMPMIDQPEIGWLGCMVRPGGSGGVEWLVQAKTEPGNMNGTQLAPALQATRSNYLRIHGGRRTMFLNRFRAGATFLSDAPYSEQGTQFLWKFNRNSVLAVARGGTPDLVNLPNWTWCPGPVLRDLLAENYRVNTDARSVIATAPWALLSDGGPLFQAPVLARSYQRRPLALDVLKRLLALVWHTRVPWWNFVPFEEMEGWQMTETALCNPEGHATVACFAVEVQGREVDCWCQPFLLQSAPADHALLMRISDTGAEVFLRVYQEVGFATRREFGPSLHGAFNTPGELARMVAASGVRELTSLVQSDEGGRFMNANIWYRILFVPHSPQRVQYSFGRWVGLSTLEKLAGTPGCCSNELRSLVSLLLSKAFDDACTDL